MYALVYDENDPKQPLVEVLSVHKSRKTAERALEKRMRQLGKRVWECQARIVWSEQPVHPKDLVRPADLYTWRPGEKIPVGERYADSD
jgi:hypothetical protein